jgi:hypothetical protein
MASLDGEMSRWSKARAVGASTSDMIANGEIVVERLAVGHWNLWQSRIMLLGKIVVPQMVKRNRMSCRIVAQWLYCFSLFPAVSAGLESVSQ